MTDTLTGRISSGPDALLDDEVLRPQFAFEAANLLPWYLRIEKTLLLEYRRMGLIEPGQAAAIADLLDTVDAGSLAADPRRNMSDIAFAVERRVEEALPRPVPAWHVDRSRNDLQACAQLLFVREQLVESAGVLGECFGSAEALARRHLSDLMPGYTHLQPAQVMTPGFYLAGLSGALLHVRHRLLAVYDDHDLCPLGAGAMTGQELPWDRERMARLLGFGAAHPHPLTAVASRVWVLESAAELSTLGVVLSRFVTDLMAWSSGEYRFLALPDRLAGISSAMPQKKNYPVLERIRGRTAHLTAGYLDVATAQRATAFGNSVEVAKEGSARLHDLFLNLRSVLRMLGAVLDHAEFDLERMRDAVAGEYLGGFSLANALTLEAEIPWRTAQVIAGRYIVAAVELGLPPGRHDPALLEHAAAERGFAVPDAAGMLARTLEPEHGVLGKQRTGSAHPQAVAELLDLQREQAADLGAAWRARAERTTEAALTVQRGLSQHPVGHVAAEAR
jgi:argininosuccinate lyase